MTTSPMVARLVIITVPTGKSFATLLDSPLSVMVRFVAEM